jgi:hypothetical protein
MNAELARELLNELGSSLESLETQYAALLQFMSDKGIVTEGEFAPYLDRAGKASSVRWRAARVRLERLFSAEKMKEEMAAEKERGSTDGAQASNKTAEDGTKVRIEGSSRPVAPVGGEAGINNEAQHRDTQSNAEKDQSKG